MSRDKLKPPTREEWKKLWADPERRRKWKNRARWVIRGIFKRFPDEGTALMEDLYEDMLRFTKGGFKIRQIAARNNTSKEVVMERQFADLSQDPRAWAFVKRLLATDNPSQAYRESFGGSHLGSKVKAAALVQNRSVQRIMASELHSHFEKVVQGMTPEEWILRKRVDLVNQTLVSEAIDDPRMVEQIRGMLNDMADEFGMKGVIKTTDERGLLMMSADRKEQLLASRRTTTERLPAAPEAEMLPAGEEETENRNGEDERREGAGSPDFDAPGYEADADEDDGI